MASSPASKPNAKRRAPAPPPAPPRRPVQAVVWRVTRRVGPVCLVCRGLTLIDRGVDPETDVDLIEECVEC